MQIVTAAIKLKDASSLEESYDKISILKSRDITLPTKVHLVKAMFFSVVMYGCELDHKESWVPKNRCFWTLMLEKTLKSPLNYKEIQPVHPKGNQLEGLLLKLKLQYFGHLMQRTDPLENILMLGKIEGRSRRGWQRMRWFDHWLEGHEFEQAWEVGDGQGSLACCSPWGHKELDMTEWLN